MKIEVQKLSEKSIDLVECDDNSYYLIANSGERLDPFERKLISMGLSFKMPKGIVAHVVPLLDLFYARGIHVLESIYGSDEPIVIAIMNMTFPDHFLTKDQTILATSYYFGSTNSFHIDRGDKLAKIVFHEVRKIEYD